MKCYKVRREGAIVAVCSELDFRRWQKKHAVIVVSDANRVEAVQVGEVFYRDTWMAAESGSIDSIPAEVIEISEEEYAALAERLKTEEELAEIVEIEPPAEEPETPTEEPVKKTVGQLLAEQQARIDELSRQLVTAGIYGGV